MLGGGPGLKRTRELAEKLGISDGVIFTGPVDYSRVPGYLMACDIGVHFSTLSDRLR